MKVKFRISSGVQGKYSRFAEIEYSKNISDLNGKELEEEIVGKQKQLHKFCQKSLEAENGNQNG